MPGDNLEGWDGMGWDGMGGVEGGRIKREGTCIYIPMADSC